MFLSKFETNTINIPETIIKDENQNEMKTENDNIKRKLSSASNDNIIKRAAFGDITNGAKNTNTKLDIKIVPKEETKEKKLKDIDQLSDLAKIALKTRISDPYPIKTRLSDPKPILFHELYKDVNSFNKNHNFYGNVIDFDKETIHRLENVSDYATDIFNYYKNREDRYKILPYMNKQRKLAAWMRALLVDWMVGVQQVLELNHEALYLAVKIVDTFLSKAYADRNTIQLIGAAALFIACKYDERIPPLSDDILFLCDGAYTKPQLLKMERNVLRQINFDLGFPLSYRFLRRYARTAKICMSTLTLARFILELSLMEYSTIKRKDSKLAAAALYVALCMKNISSWTPTLKYYTGYNLDEIYEEAVLLNRCLHRKVDQDMQAIRKKYSEDIFYEVALIPPVKNLENVQLF